MTKCAFLFAVAAIAVGSAVAFDSASWDVKNATMLAKAEKLRGEYADYRARSTTPAEDVTVPIELFENGEIKSVLHAKRAQFFNVTGYVWAEDVVFRQFKPGGVPDLRLDAKACLVDRYSKCCWIQGHATATHRKTTVDGDDAFYCSSNSFLKVFSNAHVVSSDIKMKGMRL